MSKFNQTNHGSALGPIFRPLSLSGVAHAQLLQREFTDAGICLEQPSIIEASACYWMGRIRLEELRVRPWMNQKSTTKYNKQHYANLPNMPWSRNAH